MITGCMNPAAVNYNTSADTEDFSCIYLVKYNGVCYALKDVLPEAVKDKSLTLSYSLEAKEWVFFHDYIADFYFATRNQLYSIKDNKIYIHHKGAPGVYYGGTASSFFVDCIFPYEGEAVLNAVNWLSEVFSSEMETEFSTITHITIWNNQQCTGRIAITDVFNQLEYSARKTQALWSFSTFRDMVKTTGSKFLLDIFSNFAVDSTNINATKPWYDQDLMHDNWFTVRLEFDNSSGKDFVLHGADLDTNKSPR